MLVVMGMVFARQATAGPESEKTLEAAKQSGENLVEAFKVAFRSGADYEVVARAANEAGIGADVVAADRVDRRVALPRSQCTLACMPIRKLHSVVRDRPVLALCGLVAAMLAACFWPFDLAPRNRVAWLQGESGLRFSGMGMALGRDVIPALPHSLGGVALTVEIALRPLKTGPRDSPHILSLLPVAGAPELIVASWKRTLLVHVGSEGADGQDGSPKRYRRLSLRDALAPGVTSFATVVSGRGGTSVYLDGRLARDSANAPLPAGAFPPARLLLGASQEGTNGWEGDLLALAVYGRALSPDEIAGSYEAWAGGGQPPSSAQEALIARYDFAEGAGSVAAGRGAVRSDIVVPAVFAPLRRVVLGRPARGSRPAQVFNLDGVLNVIGFVPFGVLATLALGLAPRLPEGWSATLAVTSGFALSLAIELAQVYIPARTSSLIDLGANTVGAAAGVALCHLLKRRGLL